MTVPAVVWLILVTVAGAAGVWAGYSLGRAAGWEECEEYVRRELGEKFARLLEDREED